MQRESETKKNERDMTARCLRRAHVLKVRLMTRTELKKWGQIIYKKNYVAPCERSVRACTQQFFELTKKKMVLEVRSISIVMK